MTGTEVVMERTLADAEGNPTHTIVVEVRDAVWRQDDGRPGYVEFSIFEVFCDGMTVNGVEKPGFFYSGHTVPVPLAEATSWARGVVKWDGCVDYCTGEDGVSLHDCSPEGVRSRGEALAEAYSMAASLCGEASS